MTRIRALLGAWMLSLFVAGCAAPVQLAFDREGGEAWTFDKPVSGRTEPAACEAVEVRNGDAATPAVLVGERFYATAPLRSGSNELHAHCLRAGREVGRSAPQRWEVALADAPRAMIRVRAKDGRVELEAGGSQLAHRPAAPITRYKWSGAGLSTTEGQPLLSAADSQVAIAPPGDGEYRVELSIADALGREDRASARFRVRAGEAEEIDPGAPPSWLDAAIVYGVAPMFFGAAGFDAVRGRLDEIAALGVTAIWLSPITQAASDDFGYAVTDHFRLTERFGAEAALRELIEAAHRRGLKVLMDFVPNHLSDEHRYYRDVQLRGERSAYADWFEQEPAHYFDWENLRNLEYDNPEVRAYMLAAFTHWVREFDVDGFRVDASWGVRERAPEFWPHLREDLRRIEPEVFLLAESSARDAFYERAGFDAAYDWTDELGVWAWRDVFGAEGERVDLARLRAALAPVASGAAPPRVFRFLNNNDTGARFVTRHGEPLTRAAAALLLTLPGVPLIYNGDEVGAAFLPYDEGPPIDWSGAPQLRAWYTQLAQLRRSTPALYGATLQFARTDQDDSVLVYRRPGREPASDVWVAINFTGEVREALIGEGLPAGRYRDLLTGADVEVRRRLRLAPHGVMILQSLIAQR